MHDSKNIEQHTTLTRSLFIVIILFTSLAQITADMYTPSLPYIAKAFGGNNELIQFTMAIYMLGFSLSHIYYGPVSDRVGRKRPILNGIFLSIIGNLVCYFAPSISFILAGRLLQGFGLGACSSVGRPLLRDLLSGGQLAKLGSHLGMINVFVVSSAPILGGYIQHFFGWRANFMTLCAYSLLAWILVWKMLPETNKNLDPAATKLNTMLKNYRTVLSNREFLGYTFCSCFAYASLISYITIAPFLFQSLIGFTPIQYGWLSLCTASSFFISTYINSRLVLIKGIRVMVRIGNYMLFTFSLLMLLFALLGYLNAYVIIIPITFISMGAGFTFSNAFAGAFHPFPKMAGSAGALYGCIQIMGAAGASTLISLLPEHNQIPLAIILSIMGLLSILSLKSIPGTSTH